MFASRLITCAAIGCVSLLSCAYSSNATEDLLASNGERAAGVSNTKHGSVFVAAKSMRKVLFSAQKALQSLEDSLSEKVILLYTKKDYRGAAGLAPCLSAVITLKTQVSNNVQSFDNAGNDYNQLAFLILGSGSFEEQFEGIVEFFQQRDEDKVYKELENISQFKSETDSILEKLYKEYR